MAANNLGTAYIRIAPQMDGIQSSISNAIKGATKSGSSVSTASIALGNVISKGIGVAMNAVTSSVDAAIRRTDIINNFPKVMSNMGISAEQSQKSIDTLVKKLDGLPTALQDGAAAVQRFTSKNGDVQKSTDIFLALNNALLAGGQSTEQQATALEQLSQAYAKGKPDMMEWRSMQQAMPAQLRQIAQAMGYGADGVTKLGEDLRNGKLSMDDFINTIIKLNKEGTGGFKSFEEQARNSTDGIGTAMTNVRNRIAAALQKIINAFGSKDIAEAVNKFSSNFGKMADWIVENIVPVIKDKVIPAIKNVLAAIGNVVEFIKQNEWVQHTLLNVLNIIIAFKAVSAVTGIIKGVVSAVSGFAQTIGGIGSSIAGAATAATTAHGSFSLLTSTLGKVGIAAAAVTAAVVGVQMAIINADIEATKATTAMREYERQHYGVKQAAEGAKKAQDLLKDSVNELRTAEEAATNAEIAEIQARQDQARYLEEMNRLKTEGKEDTDEYRLAELEYTKALAQEKKAQQDLAEANKTVAESKKEIDDLNSSNLYRANQVIGNILKEKGEYGNLAKQLDELKTKTISYKDEQGNLVEASLEKSQEMVEGLAQQLSQGDETWRAIVKKAEEEGISFAEACAKYGAEGGASLTGNFQENVENTLSLVTTTGQETVDAVKNGLQGMAEAGKGAAFNLMGSTISGIAEKQETLKNAATQIVHSTKLSMASVTGFWDVGANFVKGVVKGMQDTKATAFTQAGAIIKAMAAQMRSAAQIHSPSKVTAEIGKFMSLGLAKGIEDYTDEAVEAAETATKDTLAAFNEGDAMLNATPNQLQPYNALTSGMNGSGGQVTQYNTFNQVDTNLDMTEISKRLGWQVATAL